MSRFRLKLRGGMVAPGPAESFLTERPNKEKPLHDRDVETFKKTARVQKCHAFLQAFQTKPTGTNSFGPVEKNYVVVGRGFAASTNLATLRSPFGKTRVDGLNLILIGQVDPWRVYVQHHMNQEVELLTLPGYLNRPALPDAGQVERWLDSRKFSRCNAAELERAMAGQAKGWPKVQTLNANITWIEKVVERGKERFVIHFHDRKVLNARKVDLCTGTGQQTYAEAGGDRGIQMSGALWDEYLDPHKAVVDGKVRLISAEMFVAGDRQVIPGASVLITSANSPAGVQAGEHALCEDGPATGVGAAAEVVLIASDKMNGGFPPIGRLDSHARTREGALPVRLTDLTAALFPTKTNVWFGESYRVKQIEVLNEAHLQAFCTETDADIARAGLGRQLLVTLAPASTTKPSRFVNGVPIGQAIPPAPGELEADLVYGLFDQVVISTGRARGGRFDPRAKKSGLESAEKEEGSAMQLVWGMKDELAPISVPGYDFPVGLQNANGRLRILGAAGLNNPIYKGDAGAAVFKKYEDSLPWQARVAGEGVTLAALTIALANHYFKKSKADLNACVNTATAAELKLVLGERLGKEVFEARHWRVRPFRDFGEAVRVLEALRLHDAKAPEAQRADEAALVPALNDSAALLALSPIEGGAAVLLEALRAGLLLSYAHSIDDSVKREKIKAVVIW